jgi:hypothetical protein
MDILIGILYLIVMGIVLIGVLALCKKFVFSKVHINKFIPLGIGVGVFIYQLFFRPANGFVSFGITTVIIVLVAWFWDINQTGGPKKFNDKKIVIKPKAKPNRVKKEK